MKTFYDYLDYQEGLWDDAKNKTKEAASMVGDAFVDFIETLKAGKFKELICPNIELSEQDIKKMQDNFIKHYRSFKKKK